MPFADVIGHNQPKKLMQAAISNNRLAHAYLFHGEDRIGKRLLAIRVAQALLCDVVTHPADGCGICRSCVQIESRTHPDFSVIHPDPEQTTPQIKIEQIRDLEQQIIYRPLIGDRKICVIDDADRLTIGAANALLKTLEEPPDHSLFLVVSSRAFALPATIRSRCQALRFAAPAQTQIEAAVILRRNLPPADARFLAILSEGRIGEALDSDVDAMKSRQHEYSTLLAPSALRSISILLNTAETLSKTDRAGEALAWLQRWLRDILTVSMGGTIDHALDLDRREAFAALSETVHIDALIDLLEEIDRLQGQSARNLNLQIALENVLIRFRDLFSSSADALPRR
ncbi:MAG: DNA polymerase III subunit delta' [Nitrospiraceae bacterium]